MKILVTGGEGFVGKETIQQLNAITGEVRDTSTTSVTITGSTNYMEKAKAHLVLSYDIMNGYDIRDAQQLEDVVLSFKPDRILHLAAIARFSDADKDPKLAFETNVVGTANVAHVAKKHHIPVVYSSTGSVYMPITDYTGSIKEDWAAKGNSVYGCTKYMGELYIKEVTPHIILRYAHLYGKEKRMHGLIGGFADRIKRGRAPTLYGGKQSNDFTYIKDVARANVLALTAPWDKWNNVYNIGTGEEITAEHAGRIICDATGWKGEIEIKEARTVDPERFAFNCEKAAVMLNFRAEYNFEAGLKDMFGVEFKDEGQVKAERIQ